MVPLTSTSLLAQTPTAGFYLREELLPTQALCLCRYKVMSEHEIKLDRYAKFRNLGQVSEDLVMGGKIKEAQAERQQVG